MNTINNYLQESTIDSIHEVTRIIFKQLKDNKYVVTPAKLQVKDDNGSISINMIKDLNWTNVPDKLRIDANKYEGFETSKFVDRHIIKPAMAVFKSKGFKLVRGKNEQHMQSYTAEAKGSDIVAYWNYDHRFDDHYLLIFIKQYEF